jgi:hypothetical protein
MQAGGAGMGAKHMSDPTRKTGGKIAAPFEKIAPLFFRKVPLNFAKQVVLLQTVAFMLVCCTVM